MMSTFRIFLLQAVILINGAFVFGSQLSESSGHYLSTGTGQFSLIDPSCESIDLKGGNTFEFSRGYELSQDSDLELVLDEEDDDDEESNGKVKRNGQSAGNQRFLFYDAIGYFQNAQSYSSKEDLNQSIHDEKRYVLIQVFRL